MDADQHDEDERFYLYEYLRKYKIADCLQNIENAFEEIKYENFNTIGKIIIAEIVVAVEIFSPVEIQNFTLWDSNS